MGEPTYQDASLMLQLAQWGSTMGLQQALNWVWSDQFVTDFAQFQEKYPPGSDGYASASKVCGWYETLGTLYKYSLFNEELLFDWLLVSAVWDRLEGFALGLRELVGDPRLYENFEAMAKAQKG